MAVSELLLMDKRTKVAKKQRVLARIERVSELLAKGYNVSNISKDLFGNDKQTLRVYQWIERITRYAEKRILTNTIVYIQNMTVGYQKIIQESWESWERSKCDHKGEPRSPQVVYLDRALAAMEAFRKLHGLDKIIPKSDDSGNNGKQQLDWDSLTARKSLSSVTVNINGNTNEPTRIHSDGASSIVPVSSGDRRVEELKDAIDERIEELHRRAEVKVVREAQCIDSPSLQDVPERVVTQPSPIRKVLKVKRVTPIKHVIVVPVNNSPLGREDQSILSTGSE